MSDEPPRYDPNKWNKNKYVKNSHNCYAYALNLIYPEYEKQCEDYMINKNKKNCSVIKPQPGMYSKNSIINTDKNKKRYECKKVQGGLLSDNPFIKISNKDDISPTGYYKISLTTNNNGKDYHFYRQDESGYWSHKYGGTKATNKDKNGGKIKDPQKIYPKKSEHCGFYLVPVESKLKKMSNGKKIKENFTVQNENSNAEILLLIIMIMCIFFKLQ